jgi:hypothetical protein
VAGSTFKEIGDKLSEFVDWVKEQLEDDAIRKSIAEDIGLQPGESVPKAPLPQDKLDSIKSYRSRSNPDKETFIILLNDLRAVYGAVRQFISGCGVSGVTAINEATSLLFDLLAANYFRLYEPRIYFTVQLLASLVQDSSALETGELEPVRFGKALLKVGHFILSPFFYVFGTLKTASEDEKRAQDASEATLILLAAELSFMTKEIIYGWDSFVIAKKELCNESESRSKTPKADVISERMLTFAFPFEENPTSGSETTESLRLSVAVKSRSDTDSSSGLFLGVGGQGEVAIELTRRWKFVLQASATPAFSLLFDVSNSSIKGHGPLDLPLKLALVSIPDETNVTYALPDAEGTRVEIGQLALSLGYDGKNGQIKAQALRCALVLATKDQDGFLSKILPSDGLRVPFTFGVGFSGDKGFFREGNVEWPTGHAGSSQPTPPQLISTPRSGFLARTVGDGASQTPAVRSFAAPAGAGTTSPSGDSSSPNIPNLSGTSHPELGTQVNIHIGKALLAVRLDHITLGLAPSPDTGSAEAEVEVSVSFALSIGPVTAVVDRIGFQVGLSFPENGGNIGAADLSMGFKAPSGAGITIDAAAVTGGGFLFFDSEKGQYAGFVQLTIRDLFTITAIGVIATRLPNGAKGFSFVVLITAEGFTPIQLGLGFTLTGIGGLLAINRTCNEEFLRDGIRNKTLNDILFPKDPIRNAPQIFGSLNNAFPPREGSYLFGPVLQICWGTPAILTMDLGLILELGNRTRLVILGRVSAIMPTEKHDLVRLQMNAIGVIDFDQDSISLDAVLYDSRLVGKFTLTGSMAMRLNWGSSPEFALSIGGFHPAFKPPPNFPTLERLAISFSNTNDFRLRAECYFAITANTLQWGAKVELFAKAGDFSVEGVLGYDVLIQFDPFFFLADFYASVQLKYGSHNLFKVKVEGELAGPKPLYIKGKATFEIFWCDFSVGFDRTLVDGDSPPQLEPVNVGDQLVAALREPGNWTGQLPEAERRMVTLRDATAADEIALHPLGKLGVKQKVVPLDQEIAKFGSATPADAHLFKINTLTVNKKDRSFNHVTDFFAPAQFLNLTDDEKLAAPAFEAMGAGISVAAEVLQFTTNAADILEDNIAYETVIVDSEFEKETGEKRTALMFSISTDFLKRHIALGAAARSDLRRTSVASYRADGAKNSFTGRGWTIASTADGTPQSAPEIDAGTLVSYSKSFQALQQIKQANPNGAARLMLIREPKR